MEVSLQRVPLKDKEILENMLEYYVYDFSEFLEIELTEQGKFGFYSLDSYWADAARHHPFFIKLGDRLVGFVLVKTIDSENELVNTIAEFFITKRYRRRGLGESAAQQVFDRFPGKWLVAQIEKNIPAQTFWRKIISEFTNGEYEDSFSSGKRRQTFVSPAR